MPDAKYTFPIIVHLFDDTHGHYAVQVSCVDSMGKVWARSKVSPTKPTDQDITAAISEAVGTLAARGLVLLNLDKPDASPTPPSPIPPAVPPANP